eukprot:552980_1
MSTTMDTVDSPSIDTGDSPSITSDDQDPPSISSSPSTSLTSDETKESISNINITSDFLFLQQINENTQMCELLCKTKQHFGSRINNLAYPYVIERIIQCLVVRNRSSEYISIVEEYLQRYKHYELDIILSKDIPSETQLISSWPMYIYGYSKQGHPIFYDEIASANYTNLFKTIIHSIETNKNNVNNNETAAIDLLTNFRFKFLSKLAKCKKEYSQKYNTTIFRHILILDLKDFSYKKVASNLNNFMKIAKPVIKNEQCTFPECSYKTYLINSPWNFKILWKIMEVWFDPIIKQKIKMLGSDYLNELLKEIHITQIPKKYGGQGNHPIKLYNIPNDICINPITPVADDNSDEYVSDQLELD